MVRIAPLALLSLFALPTSSQVTASVKVRTGCTAPAPGDSLRAGSLAPRVFVPDDRGVLNIEAETVGPRGSWLAEDGIDGYRGSGYLRWNGPDLFNQPGVDVLEFRFRIEETTRYLIRLRNRHDHPDPTSENDCWFRIDQGPWVKLVDSWGDVGVGRWSFNAFLETTSQFPEYDLDAGEHVVELAGRSRNFKIDSLHVLPKSVWFANETDPEADVERARPLIGAPFSFEVGDPHDAAGLPPQTTLVVPMLSRPGGNTPCGTVLGAAGELLLAPELGLITLGSQPWGGPESPAIFTEAIPFRPNLLGQTFTLQAVLVEPGRFVFSDALDLVLGDR